jgi:hypothetical protein
MSDFPDHATITEICPWRAERSRCADTTGEGLESVVRRRIDERTHRRIKDLRVEEVDGTVVLSGRADRYYLVQLALAAAQDILAPAGVKMRIAVCMPSSPHER